MRIVWKLILVSFSAVPDLSSRSQDEGVLIYLSIFDLQIPQKIRDQQTSPPYIPPATNLTGNRRDKGILGDECARESHARESDLDYIREMRARGLYASSKL